MPESAAGANILEAERKLSQEMDKLYKPRGKVQHTAKAAANIEHLRTRVSESKTYVSRYNRDRYIHSGNTGTVESSGTGSHPGRRGSVAPSKSAGHSSGLLEWREARLELEDLMDSDNFPPDGIPDTKRCRRKSAFSSPSRFAPSGRSRMRRIS